MEGSGRESKSRENDDKEKQKKQGKETGMKSLDMKVYKN